MSRSRKPLALSVLLALGVLGGAAAGQALGGADSKGQHAGRHDGGRLRERLHLSQEQRVAIRETLRAHRDELAAAFKPVLQARRDLRTAVGAEHVDDASVKAASAALGEAIARAMVVAAQVKQEVVEQAKLSPEQQEVLKEAKASLHQVIDRILGHSGGGRAEGRRSGQR